VFLESNEGAVKLADYGSSLLINILLDVVSPDRSKDWLYWQAPETIEEIDSIDSRSDVWSLGCLVFELLSGFPPFYEETAASLDALHQMHIKKKAPQLPFGISDECEDFLNACLKYDPNDRSTIMELKQHTFLTIARSDTYEDIPNPPQPQKLTSEFDIGEFNFPASTKHVARSLTGNKSMWHQYSLNELENGFGEDDPNNRIFDGIRRNRRPEQNSSQPLLIADSHDSINAINLPKEGKVTELYSCLIPSPQKIKYTSSMTKRQSPFAAAVQNLLPAVENQPQQQALVLSNTLADVDKIQEEMNRLLEDMIENSKQPNSIPLNPPSDLSFEVILEEQEKLLREMMDYEEPPYRKVIPPEIRKREVAAVELNQKDSDDSSADSPISNLPKLDVVGIRARMNSSSSYTDQATPFALIRKANIISKKLVHVGDLTANTPIESRLAQASLYKSPNKKFIFTQPEIGTLSKNSIKGREPTHTNDRRSSAIQQGSSDIFSPVVMRRGSQGMDQLLQPDALSLVGPESPGKTHTTFGNSANTRKLSGDNRVLQIGLDLPQLEHEIIKENSARSSKRTIPNNSFGILMKNVIINSGTKGKPQKPYLVPNQESIGKMLLKDGSKASREGISLTAQKGLQRTSNQARVEYGSSKRDTNLLATNHLHQVPAELNSGGSNMRDKLTKFNFAQAQENSASGSQIDSVRKDQAFGETRFISCLKRENPVFFKKQESFKLSKEDQPSTQKHIQSSQITGRFGALTPRTKGGETTPKLIRKKLNTSALQSSRNTLPQLKTEQSLENRREPSRDSELQG
jgi:Protein kinase domain